MALSYLVTKSDSSGWGTIATTKNYDDAIERASKMAAKDRKNYTVFQSTCVVGMPEIPVEITPTYFDYIVNVKKANVVDTIPAPVCDYDDEDED